MTAELQDRQVRSWRTLAITSLATALMLSPLTSSPAHSLDVSATKSGWQESIREEAASYQELTSEISDGNLRLLVVSDENGQPDTKVLNLKTKTSLDYTLRSAS